MDKQIFIQQTQEALPPTLSQLFATNDKELIGKSIVVHGWARAIRLHGKKDRLIFIQMYDGTCAQDLQVVALAEETENFEQLKGALTGWSFRIEGKVVTSPGEKQAWELKAKRIEVLGTVGEEYPLQKRGKKEKGISHDVLRSFEHLRLRSRVFQATMRVRHELKMSVHDFFRQQGFVCLTGPSITFSDCEGAGEAFLIQTQKRGDEFFKIPAYLTVSAQLEGEFGATALTKIYTDQPSFRAEESKTTRHLAEFWHIEPEICFIDKDQLMTLAENFVKYSIAHTLETSMDDLRILSITYKHPELIKQLESYIAKPFIRISYSDAISYLQTADKQFEEKVEWGIDLGSEHEKYITEEIFECPVFIYDYPREIKSFYMKQSIQDEGKTVQAFDLLVPGIGELIGGSIREEDHAKLVTEMERREMDLSPYKPYLDLRIHGTVPHGGFGLGFERLIRLVGGIDNIKDTIPFPRSFGHYPGIKE